MCKKNKNKRLVFATSKLTASFCRLVSHFPSFLQLWSRNWAQEVNSVLCEKLRVEVDGLGGAGALERSWQAGRLVLVRTLILTGYKSQGLLGNGFLWFTRPLWLYLHLSAILGHIQFASSVSRALTVRSRIRGSGGDGICILPSGCLACFCMPIMQQQSKPLTPAAPPTQLLNGKSTHTASTAIRITNNTALFLHF